MPVHQPEIQEIVSLHFKTHLRVYMHCPRCQVRKVVETDDAKFAYKEINKFRIQHEHYVKKGENYEG